MRFRLGIEASYANRLTNKCSCRKREGLREPDQNGYHFMTCQKGNHHVTAHNKVIAILCREITAKTRCTVLKEQRLNKAEPENKMRMDIELQNMTTTSDHILGDFTTVHPYADSRRRAAMKGKLANTKRKEKEKIKKYEEYIGDRDRFYPLTMEMNGGIGEGLQKFLSIVKKEMQEIQQHDCTKEIEILKLKIACVHRKSYISNALRRARELMRSPKGYE